jgi:AcrR family transcriptional regulator
VLDQQGIKERLTAMPEWVSPAPARIRREPQQARSRARVAQILAAADSILTEEGFDALTVRRIADRAQVPIGSLYQFFPDKGSVLDAISDAYVADFNAAFDRLVGAQDSGDWSDPVGRMVDAFVELYRSHPGYLALQAGRHLGPGVSGAGQVNNHVIAAGVRRILAERAGIDDGPALALVAQISVETADALLRYAFEQSPDGDEAVLTELRKLLRLYLSSLPAAQG